MKKIKVISLFIMILLFTGCSIDYNLTILSDKSVKETSYYNNFNVAILANNNSVEEYYNSIIASYENVNGFKGFDINKKIYEDKSYLELNKEYTSFDKYLDSVILKSMFQDPKVYYKKNYMEFDSGTQSLYKDSSAEGSQDGYSINSVNIKIRFHNNIIDNNADNYDEKTNTLTWTFSKDNINKNIYFKIGNEKRYDIIFIDFVLDNLISIIIIGGFILIVGLLSFNIYHKNKKNNQL